MIRITIWSNSGTLVNMGHHPGNSGKNIGIAFWLNFSFTLLEIAGGFWTNSVAILSDALHDLGDSFSLGLAWYLQKLSAKKPDKTFTFGYQRFNTLGAFINAMVLITGSVFIFIEAIPRLWNPVKPDLTGMFILAVLGIVVNGLAVLRLRGKNQSLNEEVITWHLLEDVLGWVAVLIGSGIMYIWDAPVVDPLLSLGITAFILYNVVKKLLRAGKIFLQATPENLDMGLLEARLLELEDVREVHHAHVWTLDGRFNILTIHIKTPDRSLGQLTELKSRIREKAGSLNIHHLTIELETPEEKGHGHEDHPVN